MSERIEYAAIPRPGRINSSLIENAIVFLPILAYFIFPDDLLFLTQIMVTILYCVSLDLILGYAGILSLGHAAFFGIGAYAAGLLAAHGHGSVFLGLATAGGAGAVLGAVTGPLVLRGSDLTRLMVTLAVAMSLFELANEFTNITGGIDGLQGMASTPIFGHFSFDLYGKTDYWYTAVVVLVLFLMARRLVRSPFGLSLRGIRQNAKRMQAIGTPVRRRLLAIYVIGAAYAGVAGALLAQATQYVTVDSLSFGRSADVLLILVLGGAGRLYGAVVGAIVFMVAQNWLSDMDPRYWQFWLGALLVLIVLFARDGIVGGLISGFRRVTGRTEQGGQ